MEQINFDIARNVPIKFRIRRRADKTFVFTENAVDWDISGYTWELFIKKYAGDRNKVLSLTLGSGLRIPIYSDNVLIASFTSAQTNIQEGEYYWELVRTDIEKTYLNGTATFSYGAIDNGTD